MSTARNWPRRLLCAWMVASPSAAHSVDSTAATAAEVSVGPYLNRAIEIIQSNALTSQAVSWKSVTAEAQRRSLGATSYPQLYPVIRYVLGELRDGHSFLQLDDELRAAESKANGEAPEHDQPMATATRGPSPYGARMKPEGELLHAREATFGFVFMPQGRRNSAFATTFQRSIAELHRESPCGWIVDLRGNGGGDMWPMLAGLGPLRGDGECGRHVGRNGDEGSWWYRAGKAILREGDREQVLSEVDGHPTPALPMSTPIAVLIDRGTASSGEAIAVCFRSRPTTRFFGEHSFGASTATRGFELQDGANLVIAVATFADTAGNTYPAGVSPDEIVAIGTESQPHDMDPTVTAAVHWLAERPECQPPQR